MLKLPEIKMRVFHQGLILVGVPLLIELMLIGSLWMLLIQADKERVRENRYRQYSAMGARLMALSYELPYLIISSMQIRSDKIISAFTRDIEQIRELKQATMKLSKDDPILEDAASELDQSLDSFLGLAEEIAATRRSGSAIGLLSELPELQGKFNNQKNLAIDRIAAMVKIGQRTTAESERRIERVRYLQNLILLLGLISNLSVGGLLLWFYRRQIMQRLGVITQNTILLSEQKDLQLPIGGHDEIAQLDRAFHAMDRQLKEASERERALFNNASDVICVLDKDNRFIKINPACYRLWGYTQESLLSSDLFKVVSADLIESVKHSLTVAKSSSEPASFELKVMTAGNQILETLWSTFWSESEAALFCVVHDITERKNNERIKQQFLAMISSDLKRPLGSISNYVARLVSSANTSLSQLAMDKLKVADKNVSRLLGLVNDLLQIAEMESGQLEINKEQCTVEDLLKRSVQDVEGVAQKQDVKVEINAAAREWFVDPNRIMQVLVNLLSNAIKFSPTGGVVRLEARQDGDIIEIKVIDQGRGVPASYKEAIFEKFKQVEAADGKRKSGTGLGLPICKQIIEEHGGQIGVDSDEGKGSIFWFRVPKDETASMKMNAVKMQEIAIVRQERAIVQQERATAVGKTAAEPCNVPARISRGRLKLAQKGLFLVGVPILFELLFVAILSVQLNQTDQFRQSELKQRYIATYASRLLQEYFKSALLLTTDRSAENWQAFDNCFKEMHRLRRELAHLVKDNPTANYHFEKVEEYNRKSDEFHQRAIQIMGNGPYSPILHDRAFEERSLLLPVSAGMARRLQRLIDDAEKREFHPEVQANLRARQATVLFSGLAANILVSLLLAVYFSKDLTSRLAALADNAEKFAHEEKLNPEFGGSDEIAQLDHVFHSTAESLSAARKKERAVFDNSQDLICVLDSNGNFRSANPACEKMLGYPKALFLEKSILDITSSDDKELTAKTLLAGFADNPRKNLENRIVRADATQMYVLWSASKTEKEDNIYCVAHDITSRKQLEQLKQEFLAMVSHDLRTPLTSITGIAKLITAGAFGKADESTLLVMQNIVQEGDKLLELINDLLDIEKLEAGKMQLVLEPVMLKDLLDKSVEGAPAAKRAKIALQMPESELAISADRDRIIQALGNVLNHVLGRSADSGDIQVSVVDLFDSVEVAIELEGPPLSEAARIRLFDRFKETAAREERDEEGTGLALPIARKIVESHGGTIGVRVRSDNAANIFWMRLPKLKRSLAQAK